MDRKNPVVVSVVVCVTRVTWSRDCELETHWQGKAQTDF